MKFIFKFVGGVLVLVMISGISAAENISVCVSECHKIEENLSNISEKIDILKTEIEKIEQDNTENTKDISEQNIALFTLSAIFQGMCALIALTLIGTTIFYEMTTKIRANIHGQFKRRFEEEATIFIKIFFICIILFLIMGTITLILAIYYLPKVGENICLNCVIYLAITSVVFISIAILAIIIDYLVNTKKNINAIRM